MVPAIPIFSLSISIGHNILTFIMLRTRGLVKRLLRTSVGDRDWDPTSKPDVCPYSPDIIKKKPMLRMSGEYSTTL